MHSGGTHSVCSSRLLKHPLQAIKWDVKPLNPLCSLQVLSAAWIVWCLYLWPRGTLGNEAWGHRHTARRRLLSISWLNFHCCRETKSPPFSLVLGRGSRLCEGESEGVRMWGRDDGSQERVRKRDGDAGATGVPLSLGGSPGCAGTASGWRKEEEKRVHRGSFFLSPLPCNYSCIHRSLCKLTCGLRKANWDMSCERAGRRSHDNEKEKQRHEK